MFIFPALTRTLTTLYSTTLLSLLTAIQLTLLARSKYIQSVVQLERDERMQATLEAELSLSNMLLGSNTLERLLAGDMSGILDGGEAGDETTFEPIDQEIEVRFLMMSWWILHVGWKDVGERVRRGVEEVFSGCVFHLSSLGVIINLVPNQGFLEKQTRSN